MSVTSLEWSDGMGPRSRYAWLLLVAGGTVHVFRGQSIPGVVAVVGTSYRKNGKWSATTYRLRLRDGVVAISGMAGWETGTFLEGLAASRGRADTENESRPIDTWTDLAAALGVPLDEAKRFLRSWKSAAAEKLDHVDADMSALETP